MSYLSKFKGKFVYPNVETAENALKYIDEEDSAPNEIETNILTKNDFILDTKTASLSINFDNFIPASCWFGCCRLLYKISTHAIKGKVKCSFEGDPDVWIKAGVGY